MSMEGMMNESFLNKEEVTEAPQQEEEQNLVDSYTEKLNTAQEAYDTAFDEYVESKKLEESEEYKRAQQLLKYSVTEENFSEVIQAIDNAAAVVEKEMMPLILAQQELRTTEVVSKLGHTEGEEQSKLHELYETTMVQKKHPAIEALREQYLQQVKK